MRITFILPTPNLSGGIKVVAIYSRLLAGKGHRVTLISQPPAVVPLRRRIKSLLLGRGWPRDVRPRSHLDATPAAHRMLDSRRAPTDADVPDADVVIATWWETAEWVSKLGPQKGAKIYFVQGHEVFPHLPVARVEQSYRLPLRKIVVARWLRDVMRERYGDAAAIVVPNAVDHRQFHAPPRGRQDRPTVGFLFSELPLKGLDIALAVIRCLRQMHPALRVLCFGSSPPSSPAILDSGIEAIVAPPQDQIKAIYAQCDVWLATSRSEGFNLPAMEAMACRTPVVSTRTGWPAEAVVDGDNGMLAEIDDVAGLVAGVRAILALTDASWRRMSERAFRTVASVSWEASATDFERVLIDACRQPNENAVGSGDRIEGEYADH